MGTKGHPFLLDNHVGLLCSFTKYLTEHQLSDGPENTMVNETTAGSRKQVTMLLRQDVGTAQWWGRRGQLCMPVLGEWIQLSVFGTGQVVWGAYLPPITSSWA